MIRLPTLFQTGTGELRLCKEFHVIIGTIFQLMNETSVLMLQTPKKDKSLTESSPVEPENNTKKRIDEHLKDISDTISDDDIRNINTDIKTETDANAQV
jgi:hypothetical protein